MMPSKAPYFAASALMIRWWSRIVPIATVVSPWPGPSYEIGL